MPRTMPDDPFSRHQPGRGVAVILAALLLVSCQDQPPPARTPEVSVSAAELSARFRESESAADEQYSGDALLVSGSVMEVDQEEIGHPVILLGNSKDGILARAELSIASRDKAIGLGEGDEVIVRCTSVTMVAGAPMLINCEL